MTTTATPPPFFSQATLTLTPAEQARQRVALRRAYALILSWPKEVEIESESDFQREELEEKFLNDPT